MHSTTVILQPGFTLSITFDAASSGRITRLSDSAGGEPYSPVSLSAGTTTFGPFSKTRRYALEVVAGAAPIALIAPVDLPQPAVADAAAATTSNVPAGGTGTAAGGWDTAGNRDLAITRINALIADVAALRSTLNTLLARARLTGDIFP